MHWHQVSYPSAGSPCNELLIPVSLAWMELRMAFSHVVRRFDLKLDASSPQDLTFLEKFLPLFEGTHVKAHMTAVTA